MKYILNKKMLERCLGAPLWDEYSYPTKNPLPEALRDYLENCLEGGFADDCDFLSDDCNYITVYESIEECQELDEEDCFEVAHLLDGWWVALLILNNESAITYVMNDKYVSEKLRASLNEAA